MEAKALGALRRGEEIERPVIDAVPLAEQLVLRSRDASAVSLRAGNRSAGREPGRGRASGRPRAGDLADQDGHDARVGEHGSEGLPVLLLPLEHRAEVADGVIPLERRVFRRAALVDACSSGGRARVSTAEGQEGPWRRQRLTGGPLVETAADGRQEAGQRKDQDEEAMMPGWGHRRAGS